MDSDKQNLHTMLNKLKLFFEHHIALSDSLEPTEQRLHIACAALFIEMIHMDNEEHPQEQEVLFKQLQRLFSISAEQATDLIELASAERSQMTDYFQFTSLINKEFSLEQKSQLIKTMWQIAYADGELDAHEEFLVRKMADLLHVPHLEFIRTKHQSKVEK